MTQPAPVAAGTTHRPDCSRLNIFRLNAARLNVYESWTAVLINGENVSGGIVLGAGVRIAGLTIQQNLNHAVDTCTFDMGWPVPPIPGNLVEVYNGSLTADAKEFAGYILSVTRGYQSLPEHVIYTVHAIDPSWLLRRRKVQRTYRNWSATDLLIDLIPRYTNDIGLSAVQRGLPVIDTITFSSEYLDVCITQVCERVGAYWYVDYALQLHVFLDEPEVANPITDTAPASSADHRLEEDLSQVVTRVIGRGGGANAAIEVPPGSTELPVAEPTWYSATGGLVEVGTQRLTYAGVRGKGGAGAVVGTGNAPTVALALGLFNGTSHAAGATYVYSYSFVTGGGETLPGPSTAIYISGAAPVGPNAPSMRPSHLLAGSEQSLTPGGQYRWRLNIVYAGGGNSNGAVSGTYSGDDKLWQIYTGYAALAPGEYWYFPQLAPPVGPISQVTIYRTTAGGNTFYADGTGPVPGPGSQEWYTNSGQFKDAYLVGNSPYPANSAQMRSVSISNVPVSSAGNVTARKLYRTVANGSTLQLLQTIANNTSTATIYDTAADAALGAAAPSEDTSGLNDARSVAAGSPTLIVSAPEPFTADGGASGGWVKVGNMTVRYTGMNGSNLTGIPATGIGSITAAVRYGAQVLVQPRIVGIPASGDGAILEPVYAGERVAIRIERQDDAAITLMANRFVHAGHPFDVTDGVIEEAIADDRYTLTELIEYVETFLKERKDPILTLIYDTRDGSTKVGRTVTINLMEPAIAGTFRIQQVTITELAIAGARTTVYPKRAVTATNKLYTLNELLRRRRTQTMGAV